MDSRLLDWDDDCNFGSNQILLEPGIYDYRVADAKKCFYPGSAKVPQCNAATIYCEIIGENKIVTEKLFLWSKTEWKIEEFAKSIGYPNPKNYGFIFESVGKTGLCHVHQRHLPDGKIANNIDRFISPDTDMEWIQLRDAALFRDGYRCRICHRNDLPLHVHHVIEKSTDKSNKYNLDNLITICESCHSKAHPRQVRIGGE